MSRSKKKEFSPTLLRQRPTSFLAISRDFMDQGYPAILGCKIFSLYLCLMTDVWRSQTSGPHVLRYLYRDGMLAVRKKQKELSAQLGIGVRTIRKFLLQLEDWGWIVRDSYGGSAGRACIYVLGWHDTRGEYSFAGVTTEYTRTEGKKALEEETGLLYSDHPNKKDEDPNKKDEEDNRLPLSMISAGVRREFTERFFARGCAHARECVRELDIQHHLDVRVKACIDGTPLRQKPLATQGVGGEEQARKAPSAGQVCSELPPKGVRGCQPVIEKKREAGDNPKKEKLAAGPPAQPPASTPRAKVSSVPRTQNDGKRNEKQISAATRLRSDSQSGPDLSRFQSVSAAPDLGRFRPVSAGGVEDEPVEGESRLEAIERARARVREKTQAQLKKNKARDARRARNRENLKGKPRKGATRRLEKLWCSLMAEHHPKARVPKWQGASHGKIQRVVELYDEEAVRLAIGYVIEGWDGLKSRYKFVQGSAPTVGFVARFHELVINDAITWNEVREVHQRWRAWVEENPYTSPPRELEEAYKQVKPKLKELGLAA